MMHGSGAGNNPKRLKCRCEERWSLWRFKGALMRARQGGTERCRRALQRRRGEVRTDAGLLAPSRARNAGQTRSMEISQLEVLALRLHG
ncbi:hypothetical protein NDU88_003680 [Pleurodeles waltl]|uniref:Uncharacterized protein n=1 Tax=Pleurodeles waltl TaxID=8319 RepID=A0AAV7VE00_PLEWA|nr:hypothetical protein NDU88_003680 [Pleurodeles waltl]